MGAAGDVISFIVGWVKTRKDVAIHYDEAICRGMS